MLKELCQTSGNVFGSGNVEVKHLCMDSRKVKPQTLFAALKGMRDDGKKYIQAAINAGACAIAVEERIEKIEIPQIVDPNLRENIGIMASWFYGEPSKRMNVIGVTGTNGKTTSAVLIQQLLTLSGIKTGYIGTLGVSMQVGSWNEGERTTPEAMDVQRTMSQMASHGITHVVLECSSHGIDLGRLCGIDFDVCLFTNLTQDHLDYHVTMERYANAKKKLFSELLEKSRKKNKIAIFNHDDAYGKKWFSEVDGLTKASFSIHDQHSNLKCKNLLLSAEGAKFEVVIEDECFEVESPLSGEYNVSNVLGAMSVCLSQGCDAKALIANVRKIKPVPGRLDAVENHKGYHVFVDYAHTDDAFEKVLKTLRPLCKGKLCIVFGCGGDRDKTKRSKMSKVASDFADVIMLTSDNPRNEDPISIIEDVKKGLPSAFERISDLKVLQKNSYDIEIDRKTAIQKILSLIQNEDVLLITGKGHESYQEIKGVKHPYNDREVVEQFFEQTKVKK